MKVLHLLNTNTFSGAENVVCQIIGMMKNIQNVEMVYCSREGKIREALAERNIMFVPVVDLTCREIRRVIKEQNPDVIYAHDMRAGFIAACACGKIPLISHIHNNAFDSRGISIKSIAYLYAANKARHIFWVSKSSFEGYRFHALFKKKSTVLRNIIDIDSLFEKMNLDTNEYDYDIIYVGRLTFPKNPQRLMNVFRLIKEKIPNIKIAVVGTGELDEETKAVAKEYNLLDNVSFWGFQSNPLKMLHDSRVMVMTSRWEGTPMCALEAMALGVPIVSTPTDGLRDLINHGETGFLSDKDEELADYIISVITNEKLQQQLSQHSLDVSKHVNDKNTYVSEIYRVLQKTQY